ncbi:hypothetical protein, partial [Corynebacterium diphtheriae]|uniref:hypothetical protein n=1 Tax=Corynebacterium diphtheriae TaxID=1717 RepID=UPI001A9C88DB
YIGTPPESTPTPAAFRPRNNTNPAPILINRGLIIGHRMRTHLRNRQHTRHLLMNTTVTTWTPFGAL